MITLKLWQLADLALPLITLLAGQTILMFLFTYFVIFIGFIEVFTKNKNEFSIKGCYRTVLPYFLAIDLVWLLMIICWYVIGLPIGPGVYPGL